MRKKKGRFMKRPCIFYEQKKMKVSWSRTGPVTRLLFTMLFLSSDLFSGIPDGTNCMAINTTATAISIILTAFFI